MIKRPLCMACLVLIAIQLMRALYVPDMGGIEEERDKQAVPEGAQLVLTGTLCRIEEKENITAVYLKDNAVSAKGQQFKESKLLVYVKQNHIKEMKMGNKVRVSGKAAYFEGARNPGNFDQREYYLRKRIRLLVWADTIYVTDGKIDVAAHWLSCLRNQWKALLVRHLGEYYGNTMSAILLGEKSGLDQEMKLSYQKSGIAHLLAISGLHMSFIGMGVYGFFRRMGFPFVPAGILGGAILVAYALMAGMGVSVIRAMVMFLVRAGADMTGRDYDLFTSLSLPAAVICLWQPLFLMDAGFQLSFGAILGIAFFTPVTGEILGGKNKTTAAARIRRKILQSLSASVSVNLMLLGPLLYFYFEIPPYSIFLNLIVIPAMPAVMGAGVFGSAAAVFSEPLGGAVFRVCSAILRGYDILCGIFEAFPGSRFVTGRPSAAWLIIYYAGMGILYLSFRFLDRKRREEEEKAGYPRNDRQMEKRLRRMGTVSKIPGLLLLLWAVGMAVFCRASHVLCEDNLEITVLDVGQGDCIFLRSPRGDCYLVDGGSSDVSSVGTYRIEPFLLSNAVDRIEYVFVTHGDEDHLSGVREMLTRQEKGVRIENLVLPPEEYLDGKLLELAHAARQAGTRIVTAEAGQMIREEENRFRPEFAMSCLGPEKGLALQPGNEASMILEVRYGSFGMLLTGDVEGAGEKALVENGRLGTYTVLKTAHHGSKNSGSDEFLQVTGPDLAVISAGTDNRYGHPHAETLERLSDIGCSIYSTQHCGAVMISTDGSSGTIRKYLN